MQDEFSKLSKAGQSRLKEGDVKVGELNEQQGAMKHVER